MRALLAALCLAWAVPARADSAAGLGDHSIHAGSGAATYQHICQGCHMAEGRGAVGVGTYLRLAGDARLAAAKYPVVMLLKGNGAMPWFNGLLTPAQIADVVNYVRSHFGNSYTDVVTVKDVVALQGPALHMER